MRTENLLQNLEERLMTLLTEVEELRKGIDHLTQENSELKSEREIYLVEKANFENKLQELISLFDAIKSVEGATLSQHVAAMKPVLIQG